jgi:MraZ protein
MPEVRVDKAGRFTLPAEFRRYLESQDPHQIFITTLDRKRVHIFPGSVWRARQEKLHQDPELTAVVRRLLFTVQYFGADTAPDEQGRVVLPARLRELLKLENTTVALWAVSDRIEVLTREETEAMNSAALASSDSDLEIATNKGLL